MEKHVPRVPARKTAPEKNPAGSTSVNQLPLWSLHRSSKPAPIPSSWASSHTRAGGELRSRRLGQRGCPLAHIFPFVRPWSITTRNIGHYRLVTLNHNVSLLKQQNPCWALIFAFSQSLSIRGFEREPRDKVNKLCESAPDWEVSYFSFLRFINRRQWGDPKFLSQRYPPKFVLSGYRLLSLQKALKAPLSEDAIVIFPLNREL